MAHVYVSLGSNIDPETHICACMQRLQQDFPDVVFSRVYRTPAAGFEGNPFLNLVAGFTTGLTPVALQTYLKEMENASGRTRSPQKFSSRTLDADLLLYDDLNLQPEQNLPHKDILSYPFVLFPLAETAPSTLYPGTGQTLAELAQGSGLSHALLTPVELVCFSGQTGSATAG